MKKILTILLSLLLLVGCSTSVPTSTTTPTESIDLNETGTKYLAKLKGFTPKAKSLTNANEANEEFDKYLNELFVFFVKDDYMTLSDTLNNYSSYGIKKPEVTLGKLTYGADEVMVIKEIEYLDKLLEFDYDSLSYNQQIAYDCLEYSFYEDLCGVAYSKYDKLFNDNSGMISNLITCLVEFRFAQEEDIKDYLILVKDIDRYLNDAIEYTNKQYEDGIYYSNYSIDTTIDYLNSITSKMEDNVLISSFNYSLDRLSFISESKKDKYKDQNKEVIINEVLPAFKNLAVKLEDYKGKIESKDNALVNISKEYAEISFLIKSSDNREIDEIYDDLIYTYNNMVGFVTSHFDDKEFMDRYYKLYEDELFSTGYKEMIDYLIGNLEENDLALNTMKYRVDEIDPTADDGSVLAYYVVPKIDDLKNNVIKVSPISSTNNLDLYLTLAHEGVPGHMYQHNYFSSSSHPEIRDLIGFIGYTEGWAVYSEYIAVRYLDVDEEMARFAYFSEVSGYLLDCILDLAINYYGYSSDELKELISLSDDQINRFYDLLTDMPCVYSPYGIGAMNMLMLYDDANEMNDFNFDYFNKLLIKNGDMPFPILRGFVEDYKLNGER